MKKEYDFSKKNGLPIFRPLVAAKTIILYYIPTISDVRRHGFLRYDVHRSSLYNVHRSSLYNVRHSSRHNTRLGDSNKSGLEPGNNILGDRKKNLG